MAAAWWLPVSLAAVLVADQALKAVVLTRPRGSSIVAIRPSVVIGSPFPSRTVAGRRRVGPLALSLLLFACLVVLLAASSAGRFDAPLSQAAIGAALGGAFSNLIDVLARRGVVDHVRVGAWPAFNLADVAIVSGVIVALLTR